MNLVLMRRPSALGATIGRLTIEGVHECWTCEDVIRPPGEKVPGQTCIPLGRYQVVVTQSQRFQRPLPLLLEVPGFTGIRIHPGNTAADTEGCILPGLDDRNGSVGRSKIAFDALFAKIEAALAEGEVWIDIRNPA
ncbi:MAG: DUF5675 family protein [Bacteroidia bacterium]|jgi:hypothetical protein